MASAETLREIKELESTLKALRKLWKEKSTMCNITFVTPKREKLKLSLYEGSIIQDVYAAIPSDKREKFIVFKGKAAPIDSAKATLKELGITKADNIVLTSHSGYFNIELPHPSVLKGEEKSSKEPTNLALFISPLMKSSEAHKVIIESYRKIFSDYLEKNELNSKVEMIGFESPNANSIYSKDGEKKFKKLFKFSVSPKLGGCKWNLSIRTVRGRTISVRINSNLTILDLKIAIQDVVGSIPDRLIFGGKEINDSDIINEVVNKRSTIYEIMRIRGGMYQESSGKIGFENIDPWFFMMTHHPFDLVGKDVFSLSDYDLYKVIINLENKLEFLKRQIK